MTEQKLLQPTEEEYTRRKKIHRSSSPSGIEINTAEYLHVPNRRTHLE